MLLKITYIIFDRIIVATSSYFSAPKVDVLNNNSLSPTPDGAIEESKIISYQVAVDELLKAGRYDICFIVQTGCFNYILLII